MILLCQLLSKSQKLSRRLRIDLALDESLDQIQASRNSNESKTKTMNSSNLLQMLLVVVQDIALHNTREEFYDQVFSLRYVPKYLDIGKISRNFYLIKDLKDL